MIPDSAFSMDYYTQICVTAKGALELNCYEEMYGDLVEDLTDRLEGLSEERSSIRFAQVKEEGEEQIADAEEEIRDAETELADAEEELDRARTELARCREGAGGREKGACRRRKRNSGKRSGACRRQTEDCRMAGRSLTGQKEQLVEATVKVQRGYSQYEKGKAELDAGYAQIAPYETQYQELEAAKGQLVQGLSGIQAGLDAIAGGRGRLEELTRRQMREKALRQKSFLSFRF